MPALLTEDRPIYLQVKEYLESEILKGTFSDDEQVPSTNELAAFFGVNPITVMKGVTMLADEGVLYKKRGIGMFVSPGAKANIQDQYQKVFVSEHLAPLIERAKALGISSDELHGAIDEAWKE